MIEEMTGVIMTEEIAGMIEEVAAAAVETGAEELVIEAVAAETEVVEREDNLKAQSNELWPERKENLLSWSLQLAAKS